MRFGSLLFAAHLLTILIYFSRLFSLLPPLVCPGEYTENFAAVTPLLYANQDTSLQLKMEALQSC